MWGVVPQNLWKRMTPPEQDNSILMAMRPFLLERDGQKVVLEVGIGDRWSEKLREIYHLLPTTGLFESLAVCGVKPEEVTHVIASHNHWDHIGHQAIECEGELVPAFPNAKHFASAQEVENAKKGPHARSGSYREEDTTVIEDAGLLQTWSGSEELVPGLWAHECGGHSQGVSLITINEQEEGDTAIFWSDVVPTTHHIQPPYIMAFDVDVVRSFDERSKWLAKACEGNWLGLFYHDVDIAFGRLTKEGRRYGLDAVEGDLHPSS
jgi:glyoxylase-like metal-dependent hydrolase (beta-lactamase superfamily II)